MLRVLKILEMAWLLIAVFSVVMGAYQYSLVGWDGAKWFFGGAVVAGAFFGFRRRQRLRFEKSENSSEPKEGKD